MLKDVVEILKDTALRHKGVRTFRYQSDVYNNAQNNHKTFQVYLDDVSIHELNITSNIFKASFEMWILSQPNDEKTILDVQNEAYTIACNILAYIDTADAFKGILSVHDYSILTITHYSDDDSSGVKLSLVLSLPNPTNLCTLEDNFNDEPYEEDEDMDIDINKEEVRDIDINPIHLPTNKRC